MERVISGLGLLVLLGLAYVFSNNRQAVKPRTVVWGVGLQLLFAVIILAKDLVYSLGGLFVLIVLICVYLAETQLGEKAPRRSAIVAGAAVACAAAVGLFYVLAPFGVSTAITWLT